MSKRLGGVSGTRFRFKNLHAKGRYEVGDRIKGLKSICELEKRKEIRSYVVCLGVPSCNYSTPLHSTHTIILRREKTLYETFERLRTCNLLPAIRAA